MNSLKISKIFSISVAFAVALALSTSMAFAQLSTVADSLNDIRGLVNSATSIVVALAFLFFFWNLAMYILKPEGKEQSKKNMGWAIVAIAVMTSIWGLVSFLRTLVGVDAGSSNAIDLPSVNTN